MHQSHFVLLDRFLFSHNRQQVLFLFLTLSIDYIILLHQGNTALIQFNYNLLILHSLLKIAEFFIDSPSTHAFQQKVAWQMVTKILVCLKKRSVSSLSTIIFECTLVFFRALSSSFLSIALIIFLLVQQKHQYQTMREH